MAVSTFRETDPVGDVDQPRFLNAAVALETGLGPRELLDRLLAVELELGRGRGTASATARARSTSTCSSTATRWSTSPGCTFRTRA